MFQTVVKVLPLAVGSAISPVVLLLQAATLASRFHAVARSAMVLAGNVIVVALATVIMIVADRNDTTAGLSATGVEVGAWIRIVLAVLLVLTAIRLAWGNHQGDHVTAGPDDAKDPGVKPARYLLVGAAAMATNATSMVLFLPAVHTAMTSGLAPGGEAGVLGVLWVFILLPAFAPLVVYAALGGRGPAALERFGVWLRTNNRTIGIVVSLGFAVFLGFEGLRGLGQGA